MRSQTSLAECECLCEIRTDGECPACRAALAEAWRLYGGGRHHHLKPPGPWKSREDLIREYTDDPE